MEVSCRHGLRHPLYANGGTSTAYDRGREMQDHIRKTSRSHCRRPSSSDRDQAYNRRTRRGCPLSPDRESDVLALRRTHLPLDTPGDAIDAPRPHMDSETDDGATQSDLLDERQRLTESLYELPYDLLLYIERAIVHSELGYPDLAAGDAYRALLLTDEVLDEGFEYHEQAFTALRPYIAEPLPAALRRRGGPEMLPDRTEEEEQDELEEDREIKIRELAKKASVRCYQILSISLLLCGCLKSTLDFCLKGLAVAPEDEQLLQAQEYTQKIASKRMRVERVDLKDLLDQGLVRREIYPWNDHEPDRYSQETLDFLNNQLSQAAPKCVVKVTQLPTLYENELLGNGTGTGLPQLNQQLGLFAKEDIAPGEIVLDEFSILTANNRLKESLCDACNAALPALGARTQPVPCTLCDDVTFCSQLCHDTAMSTYHPSVCDKDIDTIGKDPDPKESPNALYLLLLARALAMAETQEVHALDLKETKYLWGDFLLSNQNAVPLSPHAGPPPVWTLPFSFASNILGPLHLLEKMDIDIYDTLAQHDLWIINTLYSKFRATASARVSTRDGIPEVAAVHPLWCLANHDCDPNVSWEWGGRMIFTARDKMMVSGRMGGLRRGDEVFSHYCDVELSVKERREWALGSLGGACMCDRCQREAAAEGWELKKNGDSHFVGEVEMIDANDNL